MRAARSWAVVAIMALLLAGCHREVDGRRIEAPAAGEWLSNGRDYTSQRFSPLTQIDRQSIGKLGLAWWTEFDTDRGQEATPLISDGVLYTTTAWSKVYAFDAKTGRRLWSYDPKVPGEKGFYACCDVVNRGAALWGGRLYVGTTDGRLIALDAKTGALAWSVQTTDPDQPYSISGAPRAVKGRIIIGNSGAEYPVRGYVSAYDAATGKLDWRFYLTPNPTGAADGAASDAALKTIAAPTWSSGASKNGGGGATAWNAITYDPKTGLVYFGTGNAGPWNDNVRDPGGQGDNLFAASIVALKADTGQYAWHYQTTPRDIWDYDAVQDLMIADLPIGGQTRHVVMQANKNGFFYVLDAASGQLLSANNFVPINWASGVDLKTGRPEVLPLAHYHGHPALQVPGGGGGHNWQSMSFSPKDQLVYIPALQGGMVYNDPQDFKYVPGGWNTGMGPMSVDTSGHLSGELVAWDPAAGRARWRQPFPELWNGGTLATAGGLVFMPAGAQILAFDSGSGRRLWGYDMGLHAIAAPVAYSIDGEEYVALMVGYGGGFGMFGEQPRRHGRLLVFKLGGTAKAPPVAPFVAPPPLDVAQAVPSKGDPARGLKIYQGFCTDCHGAGPFLPALPKSPAILDPSGFKTIVLDGALKSQGMASFRRFLDEGQVEDLRAYLLQQAKAPPTGLAATGVEQGR